MQLRKFMVCLAWVLVFLNPVVMPAMAEQVTTMSDCEKSPFSGTWASTDSSVPFLSKLDISDVCKQVVTKPVASNNPWAGVLGRETKYVYRDYTLRPSSTCSPIDCVWGRAKGKMDTKGILNAQFRMFWSQRILKIKIKEQKLLISWRIQYIGRTKPDQLGETLMERVN